nr:reverse transcriptase domain-containing protein [Tanacetum cinerariifolium]
MRTRSSSNLIVESFKILKRRNRRRSKQIVEPKLQTIVETPVATMADTSTMFELLQAPTEGYRDATVIPAILAENFKLKVGLLSLVTSSQFHGFERDDPHSHIRWFNKITSTLKYKNVPYDAIKLTLFPFSLEGAAWTWLEKEPPQLHQIDTFYNALTKSDQDSLNAAIDGNLLNHTPRDALKIIENKSKVRTSRNKPIVSKVSTTTSSPSPSSDVTTLTEIVKELILMNKPTQQATVKAIEETCVTCSGPHPYYECLAIGGNTFDAECLSLADLGASINLIPISAWKKLSLLELTPTPDFVVVDYDVDPQVPLILRKPFLRMARALIDVHVNQINVIDVSCEEYAQEVLEFSDSSMSGNPTPLDPIIASSSPLFTPFEGSDFILEEIEIFLHPSPILPPMKNENLKQVDVTKTNPSIEEPLKLELKDLPFHIEYAFLEGTDKLPVIISKELKDEEKAALLKILKVNPKIHEVIKKEVIKLLDPELIYPISDTPWVSPVHCVPKKGGMAVVKNEDNELIPTRLVTGWCVCTNYQKLNDATRKDHFPLPFMDQMLERLARNKYYCFFDGFLGYFQIPINPQDQEKTTFTCPYGTFSYRRMPFGLCNAPGTFQSCMMAIFHDMIEETMEVFMGDFSVFGDSFSSCLSHLDKMLKRYEDTNIVLNWEKCHFMVKKGIVLGHKISKSRIEVDRAKVDVIAKLPHPTSVKGAENLAVDHLSRLENPHQGDLEKREINETFPLETFGMISSRSDSSTLWFADIANYHAGNFVVKEMSSQQKKNYLKMLSIIFGTTPTYFGFVRIK